MAGPARGFGREEYRNRVARAQAMMAHAGLDCLFLTTEPEIRYFTGFLTRFWQSPTRPWFLLVPADGDPVAVIPAIGAGLMGRTWITDIRTWRAPDLADDGVSLLAETLAGLVGRGARLGLPMGHETHLRMPLADFQRLQACIAPSVVVDDDGIMRRLRMVKSPGEIARISRACDIAGRAFARVPEFAGAGVPLDEVARQFQMVCLQEGADWVPYLATGAGPGGYDDVISPATPRKLGPGDVMMLDTGLVHDGYFCDFDRNFCVGAPGPVVAHGHARLMEAVDAGFAAARPGATAADIFHAMHVIVRNPDGASMDAGRLGHGLGMQLTEWPSLIASDHTVLEKGMVLTLEPSVRVGPGKIMVHEENIVIGLTGADFLSPLAGPDVVEL